MLNENRSVQALINRFNIGKLTHSDILSLKTGLVPREARTAGGCWVSYANSTARLKSEVQSHLNIRYGVGMGGLQTFAAIISLPMFSPNRPFTGENSRQATQGQHCVTKQTLNLATITQPLA